MSIKQRVEKELENCNELIHPNYIRALQDVLTWIKEERPKKKVEPAGKFAKEMAKAMYLQIKEKYPHT